MLGVDLLFDQGDLGYTNTGDLALVGQVNPVDNIWQAVRLRLLTSLGSYLFTTDYGTNLRQFVDEPITDALKKQIRSEVETTILQDTRVNSIVNLSVSNPIGNTIQISFGIITIHGDSKYGAIELGGT